MVVTETDTKSYLHTRCYSLLSAPHSLLSQYEEYLERLKDREAVSSTSSSLLSHKLNGLLDIHDCTHKLLQLPIKQQALARECSDKCVDDLLEGSLRRDDQTEFIAEGGKYLASRKKLSNAIRKMLGNLKAMKSEFVVFPSNKDHDTLSLTIQACDSQESNTNEFEKVDAALLSFLSHKPSSIIDNFTSYLENLEMCIQDLEIGVKHLSRKLIRTRVSLLNIYNH
ncbi:hypothetical protein VNO77_11599 [Canavalia gladiata]|uniref:Uncharacterized protein n=1 Tax=Canavalia gladiata TaxID=3824 RepID=A0AAN9MC35_CANGL